MNTFSCVYWSCWVFVATCGFSLVVASGVYCAVVVSAHFLIGLFVFLILSSMSWLYILENNPLSVASLAIIFSHSQGCLFILFIVSLFVKKLLGFIRPLLFIFLFISIILRGGLKTLLM